MIKSDFITLFKVTAIGLLIAALSYLFHPEVGEFTFMMNGQPITEPFVKFGAFATFMTIIMLTAVFILLVFLDVGFFVIAGGILLGFVVLTILAPYLWSVLLAVFLIIATLSVENKRHFNK
jgi:hypothetical protein